VGKTFVLCQFKPYWLLSLKKPKRTHHTVTLKHVIFILAILTVLSWKKTSKDISHGNFTHVIFILATVTAVVKNNNKWHIPNLSAKVHWSLVLAPPPLLQCKSHPWHDVLYRTLRSKFFMDLQRLLVIYGYSIKHYHKITEILLINLLLAVRR
jgi:hypothetical protein